MLQFGSKHVCIEDVHIFKHCREMTLFLLWIGTYCISCVVQQTSGVKDFSSPVRYDDSSLAAIGHVQSIIPWYDHAQIYAPTASCFILFYCWFIIYLFIFLSIYLSIFFHSPFYEQRFR